MLFGAQSPVRHSRRPSQVRDLVGQAFTACLRGGKEKGQEHPTPFPEPKLGMTHETSVPLVQSLGAGLVRCADAHRSTCRVRIDAPKVCAKHCRDRHDAASYRGNHCNNLDSHSRKALGRNANALPTSHGRHSFVAATTTACERKKGRERVGRGVAVLMLRRSAITRHLMRLSSAAFHRSRTPITSSLGA